MNCKLLSAAVLLTLAAPAFCQEENVRRLGYYRIAGGRGGDFRAAVKEYNEVLKKAGSERAYNMWQSMSGPSEYVRVDYLKNWAGMDVAQDPKLDKVRGELAQIAARINACATSVTFVLEDVLPKQSQPRTSEIPKMVQVLRTVVKPDKMAEYMAVVDNDIVPAIRKANLKFYIRTQTRFGGPATEFRSAVAIDSWSELDGTMPVIQAIGGQAAFDKLLAKIRPLIVESEYNVYRHMPELSYTASKP
jgi:hypothetical protein